MIPSLRPATKKRLSSQKTMNENKIINRNPLVTVIVPAYNMENYIEECLDSVLQSTYSPLEVIIVDDGSTDTTLHVAQKIASHHEIVKVIAQPNMGVSHARNNAIEVAGGELILPVDADDKIAPDYIGLAVEQFLMDDTVKVVTAHGEFFGNRTGVWILPPFDRHRLATRNLISVCAMYRKSDWKRVGGYCTYIKGLEDWDFWISMLKDEGNVVCLNKVGFYYRIRPNSKRINDRKHKASVVATLNERHPEYFQRELGGPLHLHRSWSRTLNKLNYWRNKLFRKSVIS